MSIDGPVSFEVIGNPAPQGSKRHVGNGRMLESSKKVAPWREAVAAAAVIAKAGRPPMDGPLALHIEFWLPEPASLSKAKRALGPCRKPDLSKLLRSTEDALVTAQLVADDARFVWIEVTKKFVPEGGHLGAYIEVWHQPRSV